MSTILTQLESPGGCAMLPQSASREDRIALEIFLTAMRQQGHSLVADEVFEHGEPSGAIRILHYRSCTECSKKGRAV